MSGLNRKQTATLISEVSEAELAVRLIEANGGVRRPTGKTPEAVLRGLRREMPDVEAGATAMARAAILYMAECFANARKPS